MSPPTNTTLASRSNRAHVMLTYEHEESRSNAAVDCINEGLRNGALCVYASVDAFDRWTRNHISRIQTRISDYKMNIDAGNLIVVNFKPYYESALGNDIQPFIELKSKLENALKQRGSEGKPDKMIIFADAACELSRKKEFEQCELLENWWNEAHKDWLSRGLDITVICPHPSITLKKENARKNLAAIQSFHSITIDIDSDYPQFVSDTISLENDPNSRTIRILVAESDADLQTLYTDFFKSIGIDSEVTGNGFDCINNILRGRNDFDMVLLDADIEGLSWVEVARKIAQIKPSQRILITTTGVRKHVESELAAIHDGKEVANILQKPFEMSALLSTIRPAVTDKLTTAN